MTARQLVSPGTDHRITVIRRRPHPVLRGLVGGMVALSERAPGAVRRRQPAGPLVPLVLSFGEPLHVETLTTASGAGRSYGSFVAGVSTGPAQTFFERSQDTVQVYLTPVGVGRILDVPAFELAHRVVDVAAVTSELSPTLSERLHSLAGPEERLDLVERLLLRRAHASAAVPAWVPWVWDRIQCSGGLVRIGDLVAQTGFSHRHLSTTFRRHAGLTPKSLASLVRFDRAAADLANPGPLSLADVAARHGYADQSHLARAVLRHAGETPGQLAAARRPTPTVALGGGR